MQKLGCKNNKNVRVIFFLVEFGLEIFQVNQNTFSTSRGRQKLFWKALCNVRLNENFGLTTTRIRNFYKNSSTGLRKLEKCTTIFFLETWLVILMNYKLFLLILPGFMFNTIIKVPVFFHIRQFFFMVFIGTKIIFFTDNSNCGVRVLLSLKFKTNKTVKSSNSKILNSATLFAFNLFLSTLFFRDYWHFKDIFVYNCDVT